MRGYDPEGHPRDGVAPHERGGRRPDADLVLSVNSSHDAMTALVNALPALRDGTSGQT